MVAYSALKAGGFNPILQNINAAQMNMFEALALGGYWIFLPEDEQEEARDWQIWLSKNPIKDSDAYVRRNHYWGSSIVSSCVMMNIVALPILLLGAIIYQVKRLKIN